MISSNPTAKERAKYETWLEEAEDALHRLNVGDLEVVTNYSGEMVTYTRTHRGHLVSYIAQLRKALGKPRLRNPGLGFKPVVYGGR